MISKYLDPKNDLAFKKIFGEEKHKRLPMAFLNAVFNLQGEDLIVDLEFLNTIQSPEVEARKESIVDVLVRDQKGSKYVVEMQVAKIEGFEKRAQFYAAKTYCSHFKVIFLAITSYIAFPEKEGFKSDRFILDAETHEHGLQDFSFTFVELPKFNKKADELKTLEEQWYYFLKHAEGSPYIHATLAANPEIKAAYEILEGAYWSEKELLRYDKIAMSVADARGALAAARNDGYKEGLRLGLQEEKLSMAKRALEAGLPIEEVVRIIRVRKEDLT